jgi:hypothetical protein
MSGDLYVTNQRLVFVGAGSIEYPLAVIEEADVATHVLRLVVGEGRDPEITLSDPSALRVVVAAVREAARRDAGEPCAGPGSSDVAGDDAGPGGSPEPRRGIPAGHDA